MAATMQSVTEEGNSSQSFFSFAPLKSGLSDFDCIDAFLRNMSDLDLKLTRDKKAMHLCRMNIALWNVIPPLYLLVGTFSNALSIVVWSKKKLAHQTQYVSTMFMWLAIFDLSVLYTGLLKHYLKKSLFRWDLQDANEVICKSHEFLIYLSLSCSSWMVAIIAVDRCTCILFSHPAVRDRVARLFRRSASNSAPQSNTHSRSRRAKACARPKSVYVAVGFLIAISVAVNAHIFWTQKHIEHGGGCRHGSDKHSLFLLHIRPMLDLLFAGVLPIIAVIVSSILLLCAICCCFHKNSLSVTKQSNSDTSEQPGEVIATPMSTRKKSAVSKMSNKITWTLISIAMSFLICNVPARIYLMLYPSVPTEAKNSPSEYFRYRFTFSVLALLQFLSNVINFFIYSAGKELFRKELRETLFKHC